MSIEAARGIGDEAAATLDKEIDALMKRAASRVADELSALDVRPDGRIVISAANISRINAILDRVSASLFDDRYLNAVADYLDGLNQVSSTVSDMMKNLGANDELLNTIAQRSKSAITAALLSPSSFRDLFGSVAAQLINGIVTGAAVADVARGMRESVSASGIDRGIKSQLDSAPAAMQRAQTAAASEQAGIVFYRFQGRPIPTTRPWCREREGHDFHVEEIREWGRQAATGKGWDGMVEGTNEQTIFTYLGGWYGDRSACRHVLIPVLPSRVPAEDMARMRAEGLVD